MGSVNHEWGSKTIDVYQVEVNETYQVAEFQVNSLCPRKPFRAGGLDDEEEGTVDEDEIKDLEPFAPIGDVPWGVILFLACILLYTKQRKSPHTHSKSIANMKSLSRPLSILLFCLLLAPAAKADYTLKRLWRKDTGKDIPLKWPTVDISDNTNPGTCGAFIVDTAGLLYIDDNTTKKMVRLFPNGDIKDSIPGCEDVHAHYPWCEYDPKTNTVYWFVRNKEGMAWIKYRNITDPATEIQDMSNIYTSTAQVALSPDQYLWTASWSEINNCTIRRAKLTNLKDGDGILIPNQQYSSNSFLLTDLAYIAPIDSTRALVVDRSTATYYCVLSQETQSLTPITLEKYPGLTGCHSTLGGTVFQMGGKYYYTAGRSSDDQGNTNYQGAFTVYKFNEAAPSDNITKTYFTHDIGLTDTPNTTTVTVTFRTVVKHDATYGDYALIYQFVPGHGVACYYYTEEDKDEQRTVNISVTNGTASCESKPITEANVRYFAKFHDEGETLTITWGDENGDATQTQTIVAKPQYKSGYKAVFQGWKLPKNGYLTEDCEIMGEYVYELEADAGQADFLDRLVTWKRTATDTTITFDLNGFYYLNGSTKVYPSNSGTRMWKINHTDVTQETTNLDPVMGQKDKTFTITIPAGVSLTGEEYVYIELYDNSVLVGGHAFPVPVIDNQPKAGRDLYLHGDLTITGSQTAKNVYIEPSASLTIANGVTLIITDTLYIRSRGTKVGQLLNYGTLSLGDGKLLYTRQMAQKNTAEPLAMPFPCTLPKTADGVACITLKTRLQAETGKASGNHVVLKKYKGAKRADGWDGTAAALWEKLSGADITLNTIEGYEIVSGSAYYREYLFPLTYNKSATAATTANLTAYKTDKTAPHNIGWNFLCTPYTSGYTESIDLAPSNQKYAFIVRYAADGSFITSINMGGLDIPPFTPFYVQVNGDGTKNNQEVVLTYAGGAPVHLRVKAQAEENPTSWASITLSDGNDADQTTLIICNDHNDGYEVGADCEKWLTTATRPQVYTVAMDGLRAFNALPEATATRPVAVGYYSPKAAEMTFSLNEDFPLEKIEHLYLSDYETGNTTDLIANDYAFFTAAGTFNERFALSVAFRNEVSTDINGETNTADQPRKVMKDGQLYIIVQGRILDITGREMGNFK